MHDDAQAPQVGVVGGCDPSLAVSVAMGATGEKEERDASLSYREGSVQALWWWTEWREARRQEGEVPQARSPQQVPQAREAPLGAAETGSSVRKRRQRGRRRRSGSKGPLGRSRWKEKGHGQEAFLLQEQVDRQARVLQAAGGRPQGRPHPQAPRTSVGRRYHVGYRDVRTARMEADPQGSVPLRTCLHRRAREASVSVDEGRGV